MAYRVELTKAAVRALRKLDARTRERIDAVIEALAEEPRPTGCVKMSGRDATWRVRVGDYRVVYEVRDDRLVVIVVRVGNRRDVYR